MEGGMQGDKGRTGRGAGVGGRTGGGSGGQEGRKEGRTGGRETPMLSARHGLCTEACQWLLAFTLY